MTVKLTVKTLGGVKFPIEVEDSETIKQVKEKIKEIKSWEVVSQKLIHKGKILADDKTVQECSIGDGEFLVCVLAKSKAAPAAPAAPASTPAATPAPSAAPASEASSTTPAAPSSPAPTPASSSVAATPAPAQASSGSSAVPVTPAPTSQSTPAAPSAPSRPSQPPADAFSGPAFDASVKQLTEMGFPEDQVRAALRAAYGNTERATDFLLNGIPDDVAVGMQDDAPMETSEEALGGSSGENANTSGASGPLDGLRRHPEFNNYRRIVQSNPGALSTVLQQLGNSNPELIEAINNNRAEFVAIMNEPIEEDDEDQGGNDMNDAGDDAGQGAGGLAGMLGGAGAPNIEQLMAMLQFMQQMPEEQRAQIAAQMGVPPEQLQAITQMPPEAMAQLMQGMMGGGAGGAGGIPPHAQVVRLTQEEMDAVNRLCELGFPKQACVEAYLLCDKNENMAANYLFTNPPEPMEEDNEGNQ
mmetsp:Transcript_15313/g.29694  ORF Transcript_15313/g.29694 Transcript_15313/m.29694 type:complete len:471 (-) Transcript_15313:39-1451(-)|eukprot:CAMPEP_0171498352 /NCGR_PEP_ID=MMETSP0958-20121227/7802_1 /TAXON_ID=87120 /ORGANISM="Aurantiochytrium limacinum, Strain ATCCMYA-1381" /LENGTH=470 /DNA_ID=CAMNT_0012032741 /DNA_START=527 /DNA_END=1939 /DNA_ORIENTATION=-